MNVFGSPRASRVPDRGRFGGWGRILDDGVVDWRDGSICQDLDTDLFFPVGATGPAVAQIEAAKAVCARCDVRAECLHFAVTTNQEYGVWGGTSEEERRQLRRAWRALTQS